MDPVNCLTPPDYRLIVKFMLRDFSDKESGDVKKILLNKETKTAPNGVVYTEETYFEMNYAKGTWRKFAKRPKAAVSLQSSTMAPGAPVMLSAAPAAVTPQHQPMQQQPPSVILADVAATMPKLPIN